MYISCYWFIVGIAHEWMDEWGLPKFYECDLYFITWSKNVNISLNKYYISGLWSFHFKDGFFSFTLLTTLSFKISYLVFLQTFSACGDCFPPVTLFTRSHLVSAHATVKLPSQGHQLPVARADGQFSVFAVSVAVSTITRFFLGTSFSNTTLYPNLFCRLLFLYPSFKCCYSWRVLFASYDTAFPRIWHRCFSYNLLMVPRLLGFRGVYPDSCLLDIFIWWLW